jgi:hypothetical protein
VLQGKVLMCRSEAYLFIENKSCLSPLPLPHPLWLAGYRVLYRTQFYRGNFSVLNNSPLRHILLENVQLDIFFLVDQSWLSMLCRAIQVR